VPTGSGDPGSGPTVVTETEDRTETVAQTWQTSTPEALAAHLDGVRAVLLDIDHTVLDTAAGFSGSLDHALVPRLRAALGPDRAEAVTSADVITIWHADSERHYLRYTRGEVPYHAQRHARVDQIAAHYGLEPFTDAQYEDFSADYDAVFAEACVPFAETRSVLESLVGAGVPVGAVTNASKDLQERKLAAQGLGDLLPVLVTVDTFGVGKPDPRLFQEGARLLGVAPQQAVYVGDEPDLDAQAATEAGLRGVRVRRATDDRDFSGRELPADQRLYCEVGDLTALPTALALPPVG
jgi:putative hydrolase of the HAD superfamily